MLGTAGLIVVAVGAFLPWARIGGRNRSGFSTADTFIRLADGVLPNQIAWVGRWWYLPAFLIIAAWVTLFFAGRAWLRTLGVILLTISLAMWWLFVWAGRNYQILDSQFVGPVVATVGIVVIGFACVQPRASIVQP